MDAAKTHQIIHISVKIWRAKTGWIIVGLLFNLGGTVDKLVLPEIVGGVFDELNEGDEEAPGMRSVDYQSLQ